jgi:uncharacterized protein (DUF433 family)
MTITETLEPQAPPLYEVEGGTIRVTGTRVSLDSVVWAFNQGGTAEEIVQKFPTLKLVDVYAVIAYYLRNRVDVDAYLALREREGEEIKKQIQERWPNDGIRERLLARRNAH